MAIDGEQVMYAWLAEMHAPRPPAEPIARYVRRAYAVLEPGGATGRLLAALPRLVAQLDCRVARPRVVARKVGGCVDWVTTARLRASPHHDGRFVVRPLVRDYDLLENQLMAVTLDRLRTVFDELPATITTGTAWSGGSRRPTSAVVAAARALIGDRVLAARLDGVSRPHAIDSRWLTAAARADVREYRLVADAYRELVAVEGMWKPLLDPARRLRLLPAQAVADCPWIAAAAVLESRTIAAAAALERS